MCDAVLPSWKINMTSQLRHLSSNSDKKLKADAESHADDDNMVKNRVKIETGSRIPT